MSNNWKHENNFLVAHYEFNDFITAFSFMQQVAFLAEAHNHHPYFINVYNKVTIKLNTHDAGNKVTEKDYQLAKAIDEINM